MASLKNVDIPTLKAEVRAAWIQACEADGIDPAAKFVVFTNTTEAAAYNELMGMLTRRLAANKKNAARRARHAAFTSCGLKRVRGAQGGVYYE